MILSDVLRIINVTTVVAMIAKIIAANRIFLPLLRATFFNAFCKMYIWVLDEGRGDRLTAVHMMTEPEGPVIMQSDRPVADGGRVRLVGEQ